jgi:His-Xaa-Ser repeat protein HxsA
MNLKRILMLGAVAMIACGTPTAYAGYRHHHRHSSFSNVSIGFGFSSYPYWGYGYYPRSYYSYYPYGYGYSYYPYGSNYYPYSYGYYSAPRSVYRGQSVNANVAVRVQERLARAGYYHGAIDGVIGPETRRAIRAYERAHNLRVDGAISDQLLGTMGLRY